MGGIVKRTADQIVAHGTDITNINLLKEALSENLESVNLFVVKTEEIQEIEKIIPEDLNPFKGTMATHHVTWRKNSEKVQMRRLSCLNCVYGSVNESCVNYALGDYVVQKARKNKKNADPNPKKLLGKRKALENQNQEKIKKKKEDAGSKKLTKKRKGPEDAGTKEASNKKRKGSEDASSKKNPVTRKRKAATHKI